MSKISVPEKSFHLSVVATSRNDNHGGDLIARMQLFLEGFVQQCTRHDLSAELILVEWNPPSNKSSLAEILKFPKELGLCEIRIITVPTELHMKLQHSDQLPLFQMIAKNVGIRRAYGKYVLATNIDIIFSDELIDYIANKIKPHHLYRADRFDTCLDLPRQSSFDELLLHCEQNTFRINTKFGTLLKTNGRWKYKNNNSILFRVKKTLGSMSHRMLHFIYRVNLKKFSQLIRFIYHVNLEKIFNLIREIAQQVKRFTLNLKNEVARFMSHRRKLHTNACGDFTLLSYEDWFDLRGYPEWDIFSWHIDSVLLYQANRNGIKEVDLPRMMNIYHMEHQSGYRPEDENQLFSWLDDKKIAYLDWSQFCKIVDEMDDKRNIVKQIIYNEDSWGYANHILKEVSINTVNCSSCEEMPLIS